MKRTIQIQHDNSSYKIGIDEIVGLKESMKALIRPIENWMREECYWERDNKHLVNESEYKSRDGFIPHSHNCGGIELVTIIPHYESYNFDSIVDFGECDQCGNSTEYPEGDHQCGYQGIECGYASEGHLDAKLRIWFKFEGLEDGTLSFYLYCGGGNGDAPYFRTKDEHDVFEASFECKSVAGLKRTASKHINTLLKKLKGG